MSPSRLGSRPTHCWRRCRATSAGACRPSRNWRRLWARRRRRDECTVLGNGGRVMRTLIVLLVHLGLDLAPLVRQAVEQAEDLLAFAGEFLAPDDLGQIGLQHALLLAFELRERGAEVLVPGP